MPTTAASHWALKTDCTRPCKKAALLLSDKIAMFTSEVTQPLQAYTVFISLHWFRLQKIRQNECEIFLLWNRVQNILTELQGFTRIFTTILQSGSMHVNFGFLRNQIEFSLKRMNFVSQFFVHSFQFGIALKFLFQLILHSSKLVIRAQNRR